MKTTTKQLGMCVHCGALLCLTFVAAPAATNYVWQDSPNPTPPYADWSTAARTIQDTVDAAQAGDTVLVTNGVYLTGDRVAPGDAGLDLYTGVVIDKSITLLSVNGPTVTTIDGGGTNRCAWLGSNAILSGFTLANGYIHQTEGGCMFFGERRGAGACCAPSTVISNCVITANRTLGYYNCGDIHIIGTGGGVDGGILYNCTLTSNSAGRFGGGAYGSTLYNCTLTGNSAGFHGGGVCESTLHNCTLAGNSVTDYEGSVGAGGGLTVPAFSTVC
jgi:hypothetical protein